ncbi:hypothetical protein K438DRAFT_1014405 [Mycena galopus ATCC 62051]|nr:hypothetical protein K438DRAFT_488474 [Mycena galopus ATCC 62051]KAF8187266.1 hypothetical protein K438DRAFT_1014405 [Mycena galopus ATCC 62051]
MGAGDGKAGGRRMKHSSRATMRAGARIRTRHSALLRERPMCAPPASRAQRYRALRSPRKDRSVRALRSKNPHAEGGRTRDENLDFPCISRDETTTRLACSFPTCWYLLMLFLCMSTLPRTSVPPLARLSHTGVYPRLRVKTKTAACADIREAEMTQWGCGRRDFACRARCGRQGPRRCSGMRVAATADADPRLASMLWIVGRDKDRIRIEIQEVVRWRSSGGRDSAQRIQRIE